MTDRSYKLHLILAEIPCDMLVIAERVRSLCKSALSVHTESFALDAEFAGIKVFAVGHIFHLI